MIGVVALLGAAGCERSPSGSAPTPAATASPRASAVLVPALLPGARVGGADGADGPGGGVAGGGAQRNLAMGTGEPRDPEAFTRERRLLDAVQRKDRATVERALELGVPVDTRDELGRTALTLAAMDARDIDLVRFLHGKGAAIDVPDVQGRAALSHAAELGLVEIVQYLVTSGAQIDRPDVQGRTPLFHAAAGDRVQVVALLGGAGANLNVRDQWGDTPLIVACAKGNAPTAALLLHMRADPSLKDQEGRTARERSAPGVKPCLALPLPG